MTRSHRSAIGSRIATSRTKRAAALVPLAMVSAAWTISIGTSGSVANADDEPKLPDGTQVPAQALLVPASLSESADSGVTGETAQQIVATSSTSAIPAAALAAYQRAETVINKADSACRLPWQLLAAIGRVESNHGRAQNNVLGDSGIVSPGIVGVQLDGSAGTARIADTDNGSYDGDATFDRAVGPLQFIPSTWSTVGVDADGDGKRDPQNLNDAALAGAVYLCSGTEDLSTDAGRRTAVLRYNHSTAYVDTVLKVYQDYLDGDFTAIPNYVVPASYFVPDTTAPSSSTKARPKKKKSVTLAAPVPAVSSKAPTAPSGTSGGSQGPVVDKPTPPAQTVSPLPSVVIPSPSIPALPSTGVEPIDQVLTKAQATAQCLADFGYKSVNSLVAALTNPANIGKNLPTLGDLTSCVTKLLS